MLHISDLHIGKTLRGYSLLEDQKYILAQIIGVARERDVDAILIAGDVMDSVRSGEDAFACYGEFMREASEFPLYVIPGNHDPVEKLACCRDFLRENVRICGPYSGKMEKYTVEDAHGKLNIFLLPYITAASVRHYLKDDESIKTQDDAFRATAALSDIDPEERNVLVCHQFVVGGGQPERGGSEDIPLTVGTAESMSASLFGDFDYVALGHIHRAQSVGRPEVRYCGSPLKYSESEAMFGPKSVVVVDIGDKGDVMFEQVELKPLRDLVTIEGTVEEILAHEAELKDQYVCAVVTGNTQKAREKLSAKLPYLMGVDYKRAETSQEEIGLSIKEIRDDDPEELFAKFYFDAMKAELSEDQKEIVKEACRRAREAVQ